MNNNGITEIESQTFAGLGSVTTLDLANNDITEVQARGFAGLGSVTTLDLANNNIAEVQAQGFAGLESVTTLDLSNNNITSMVAVESLAEFIGSKTTIILKGNPAECWTGGVANSTGLYAKCGSHDLTRVPTFINPNITHVYVRY